jgi:ABC-type sugar transport system ATPase subunit
MLILSEISKRFENTVALDRVSLEARPGQVHALVGQNGSGKSTLMKILAGVFPPDHGEIQLDGRVVRMTDVARAEQFGVGIVYQELSLFPHLSVAANVMMGHEVVRGRIIDRAATRRAAEEVLRRLGVRGIPVDAPVRALTAAQQQLVEIAKCLAKRPRIVIFDEPTASLTAAESRLLFDVIRQLRRDDLIVLYISHHLEEIYELADRVTVLRDGTVAYSGPVSDVDHVTLVQHMVGRRIEQFYPRRAGAPQAAVLLEADAIRGPGLDTVSLTVHAGEILGIGGPVGSGQTALAEVLTGVRPATHGEIRLKGRTVRLRDVADAIAAGIAYVPEDRRTEGLALNLSMRTNLALPLLIHRRAMANGVGFVRRREEQGHAALLRTRLKIKGDVDRPVATLSGGNQQKVAVARWVGVDADVYVLNDPTKGIDVSSKVDIYEAINQLADAGKGVVLVSSYNPELLNLCDRILVMYRGRVVREFMARDTTEEQLLLATASAQ